MIAIMLNAIVTNWYTINFCVMHAEPKPTLMFIFDIR